MRCAARRIRCTCVRWSTAIRRRPIRITPTDMTPGSGRWTRRNTTAGRCRRGISAAMKHPFWFGARLLCALFFLVATNSAFAEYPERPIRVIVPFPAGGTVDLVARLVTARMADDLKTSFVIENRGGAGGVIATDATAKAAPDGYTLLLTSPNHTINAALQGKLPSATEKDLVPVAMVAEIAELLVSPP